MKEAVCTTKGEKLGAPHQARNLTFPFIAHSIELPQQSKESDTFHRACLELMRNYSEKKLRFRYIRPFIRSGWLFLLNVVDAERPFREAFVFRIVYFVVRIWTGLLSDVDVSSLKGDCGGKTKSKKRNFLEAEHFWRFSWPNKAHLFKKIDVGWISDVKQRTITSRSLT